MSCRVTGLPGIAVTFLVLIFADQLEGWPMYRITCRSRAARGSPIRSGNLGVLGRMYGIMAYYHVHKHRAIAFSQVTTRSDLPIHLDQRATCHLVPRSLMANQEVTGRRRGRRPDRTRLRATSYHSSIPIHA